MLARSDIVWGSLLLVFLCLELAAKDIAGLAPWYSLSRTSWLNEGIYPILRTLLFGFLIGLAVHIRFQTGLWKTTLGGMVAALLIESALPILQKIVHA